MSVEEQTVYNTPLILHSGVAERTGQRLFISNRTVSKLGFWLRRYGNPWGTYYFSIRKISGDVIIVREAAGLAGELTETITYYEHTFSSPVFIDQEVRIMVEYGEDGAGNSTNLITAYHQNSNVKAGEYRTYMQSDVYTDFLADGQDHAYRYTFVSVGLPTVTTGEVTGIKATSATGNGNITDGGGDVCDKRGFVYDTASHGDPGNTAPADSDYAHYVEEEDGFGIGAFTGALTGLEPLTPYYVRAYAHNIAGYDYGDEVSFTTPAKGMPGLNPDFMETLGY